MSRKRSFFTVGEQITGRVVMIHAATTNTELNEGRGQQIDHSYYRSKDDAVMGAQGIGVMGSAGGVEPRLALSLEDGSYLILADPVKISENPKMVEELRRTGLAKLTPGERAALHLD